MSSDVQPGIYRISNLLSGKFYIGSSIDIAHRWDQHQYQALKAIPTKRSHLYSAMRLYGIENFICEMIEPCPPDQTILFEREQYYIDTLKPDYNLQLKTGSKSHSSAVRPIPVQTSGKWRLVTEKPMIKPGRQWSGILPVGIDGTIL